VSNKFSDYIVYVDESGDHSLKSIDPNYPVFVLAFCVFNKEEYANDVTTAVQKLKFKHFGHDMVLLHEHEIRKATNEFVMLTNLEKRNEFMSDINQLVDESSFTVISNSRYPLNPSNNGA